jgi:hypothetical protein
VSLPLACKKQSTQPSVPIAEGLVPVHNPCTAYVCLLPVRSQQVFRPGVLRGFKRR